MFLTWCVLTAFWGLNTPDQWLVLDFENGVYAIELVALRLLIYAVTIGFGYWALHTLSDRAYGRAIWAARIGLGIQALLMVGWVFVWSAFMDYGRANTSSNGDLQQNLIRIVNLTVVMVPVFVALLPLKNIWLRSFGYALCFVGLAILASRPDIDSQAAILGCMVLSVTLIAAHMFGRKIFAWLGYGSAALVILMPLFMVALFQVIDPDAAYLPASFRSRLDGYEFLLEKISEKPLWGWGVAASASWDDVQMFFVPGFGELEYLIVAGHPHNFALEIWAETGLIGALLLSGFIVLLGRRLSRTSNENKTLVAAGASLWTGALVFMLVSYSVWSEPFWAGIVFSATIILALSKRSQSNAGHVA